MAHGIAADMSRAQDVRGSTKLLRMDVQPSADPMVHAAE
jgi:hypothetical protein